MLSIELIQQMIHEFNIYQEDVNANHQHPDIVIITTAKKRAEFFNRDASIEDALFAFWGWCWPGLPQNEKYTEFMKHIHKELFEKKLIEMVKFNAKEFFSTDFLKLELHELSTIVNTPGILETESGDRKIHFFKKELLSEDFNPPHPGYLFI
jgi:hypothetical protein